jgi:hypothetical protein
MNPYPATAACLSHSSSAAADSHVLLAQGFLHVDVFPVDLMVGLEIK